MENGSSTTRGVACFALLLLISGLLLVAIFAVLITFAEVPSTAAGAISMAVGVGLAWSLSKKCYLIAGVLAVCACLTLAMLTMFPAQPMTPGARRANMRRIEIGMTKVEAESVLGSGGSTKGGPPPNINNGKTLYTWWGEHGTISLTFDDEDHVLTKQWDDRPSGSIPQRIIRWLDSLRY